MASRKKSQPKIEETVISAEETTTVAPFEEILPVEEIQEPQEIKPKYKIGSIVFLSRKAEADLNGFKLFPQYKKYTYTVEAYDADTAVYTLRRLNLSLKLTEDLILAPDEKAHDPINRKQF